ncbi:hypothetical protein [Syntrophomonas palmitatica]|uniref:hypothetical protein n=1 Tax=Syntrophomonas palmitatica TaxID=402877 RepID=UPI000B032EF5|nr:hypothetical protein [Syntrophomonas palmitatica]
MALIFRITAAMRSVVQLLGLLILGLVFIVAPELALDLSISIFRFRSELQG